VSAQPLNNHDRLLEAAEVAELLAVPVSWVRAETRAGRLPHVKLGRYRRYSWPAITSWLAEQSGGGAAMAKPRKHRPRVGS
jgi:excisionase family DNA binding protein